MSESDRDTDEPSANHGWRVTFAGLGINLALAIMYTWSVISNGVPDAWGWSQANKSLPFRRSVGCTIDTPGQLDEAGHLKAHAVCGVRRGSARPIQLPVLSHLQHRMTR